MEAPAAQSLARRVEQGGVLYLGGISSPGQVFLAALLHALFPQRPLLIVLESLKAQETAHQDLETWLEVAQGPGRREKPLFFPSWEILPHEDKLPHADVISERLETLLGLAQFAGKTNQSRPEERIAGSEDPSESRAAPVVVANVEALLQRTFPAAVLRERTRHIERGDRINPIQLVEWLEELGYEPEAKVSQKGEVSMRGGIVDLYPLTSPWPVRVEFFGDEVESIRYFDPITQVSREQISGFVAPPAGELGLLKRMMRDEGAGAAQQSLNAVPARMELASLLDYLPGNALVVLCEPELLKARAEDYCRNVGCEDAFFLPWETLWSGIIEKRKTVVVSEAENPGSDFQNATGASGEEGLGLEMPGMEAWRPLPDKPPEQHIAEEQRRAFFEQLQRWIAEGAEVEVFCNNGGERQRFIEIWGEYHATPINAEEQQRQEPARAIESDPKRTVEVTPGLRARVAALSRGFVLPAAKLVIITDSEVFGRYRYTRPRRLRSPHAQTTRSALDIDFSDLEEGDYVVHLQHGIGRYEGTAFLPVGLGRKGVEPLADDGAASAEASTQECLVIEYAPSDPAQPPPKLYVPLTEAHLVSKYVGIGKARPALNTLGGTRWAKAKAQAGQAVKDVASELLAIQAARESLPGFPFGADTAWQREFESAFIYEETPDQTRSIQETKTDMERPKPMDRLICGDVGFGKTEIAIRAAFKAVMGGKQVALLVPTTVLAQQHYNTFRERMADYPIKVELLSRFRTRREQTKVIREVAEGSVDIVIGTHRLIQSDVEFKDLGVVIIDEEQRFGVLHKEKFKRLRHLVDVLTLSATPIPRTLYLALSGARDMSTLQTPPHDRLPVQTVVTEYDERLIRDAIQREMNRGGQVFFLHNRVATIHEMAKKLQMLAPQARIVVGHGQMESDDLEEVMRVFINGQADVLLSTTIIESGLDIPNANTIIIDRADRFGLSDLYQLRGRVGRYKHQAYAYLLLPRHARLLTDVRKRMSAIKQYSTLGSGFKIAMRDLEIRGAGNLLGSEQSGHITAVGFDLYCQLLKQSVAASKGEVVRPRIEVQVRLDFLSLNAVDRPPEASEAVPWRDDMSAVDARLDSAVGEPQAGKPGTGSSRTTSEGVNASSASIPYRYVADTRQRIEIYRKLAQATDKPALEDVRKELRDRYGPIPQAVELLLAVAELKLLAAEKHITGVEVKEHKLMLTRHNDYVMLGNKFPRLSGHTAAAKLKEIRKLLLAL